MAEGWNKEQLWLAVSGEMELGLSPASFSSFVKPCFLDAVRAIDEERLLVELACPSGFVQQTIDERYYGQIKKILERQTGRSCEVALVVKQRPASEERVRAEKGPNLFAVEEVGERAERWLEAGLNPRFGFENFVVGSSNNLAYAAARGVVSAPGTKHNPLFVWGGVGVGKTHLMHAVGRELMAAGMKVRSVTSEQFTNELITTIRNKRVEEFKRKYRNVDVLMVDDIQFLAGKESTQEEFFHTFNELYMKGRQIVLTADRRPQEIEQVEERLISRFLGGLTVDIGLPDYEMRVAILRQKAGELKIQVEEGAMDMLASGVNTNVREMEGMLMRLANVAGTGNGIVSKELVEKEVGIKVKKAERRLRPQQVIGLVAREFEIKNKELVGKSRKAELVRARHLAMYLLRAEMGLTLQAVARMMGGRDHTTVMHAVEKMEQEFGVNQETRRQIMKLKQEIYK